MAANKEGKGYRDNLKSGISPARGLQIVWELSSGPAKGKSEVLGLVGAAARTMLQRSSIRIGYANLTY